MVPPTLQGIRSSDSSCVSSHGNSQHVRTEGLLHLKPPANCFTNFFFKCTFHFVINLHLLKSCTGSTESLHPVHPASLMLTPYTTMIHLSKPRNSHQHNALKKIQTHLDSTSCPKYFTFPRTLRGKHHSRHQARKEDAEAEKESMAGLWSQ